MWSCTLFQRLLGKVAVAYKLFFVGLIVIVVAEFGYCVMVMLYDFLMC